MACKTIIIYIIILLFAQIAYNTSTLCLSIPSFTSKLLLVFVRLFLYFVVVKSGGWFGMMIMVLQWNELAHSFMVKKQLDFTKQAEKCSYPCLDLIMLLCSAPSPLFPHSATIMCMYVHVT